ncbi:hypothetical protein C7460_101274 [Marinoscillum furvescens DSM 4134]|uniref:Uncharacterized protein n=1 Tax=Marinoscillum furvescens DSM 4134 TaxID=1122208 RepID=A0A3D9LIR5_MARFU|nr:hypothetical protein C7460_101274 [Marinoscillum furvescens DSM 4134]
MLFTPDTLAFATIILILNSQSQYLSKGRMGLAGQGLAGHLPTQNRS